MSNFNFTIITVVRNNVKGIEDTMLSVLNQTYSPIEYIVVDGVSTDGTLDIIKDYSSKVENNFFPNFHKKNLKEEGEVVKKQASVFRYITEPDQGIYDAMNKGISIASGNYICILNSEDQLELDACNYVNNEIHKDNYNVGLYYGMIRIFSQEKIHLKTFGSTMGLISSEMIPHPSCFIKLDVYNQLFKFNTKYKSSSDYDFILRLNEKDIKTKFLEKIISNFFLGGVSNSKTGSLETIRLHYRFNHYSLLKYVFKWLSIQFFYILRKL